MGERLVLFGGLPDETRRLWRVPEPYVAERRVISIHVGADHMG
ncbi:hypothetical protein [Sphingobium olei]